MPLQAAHLIVVMPMANPVPTHFSQIAIMLFRVRQRRNKLLSLPAMPAGNSHVYAVLLDFSFPALNRLTLGVDERLHNAIRHRAAYLASELDGLVHSRLPQKSSNLSQLL